MKMKVNLKSAQIQILFRAGLRQIAVFLLACLLIIACGSENNSEIPDNPEEEVPNTKDDDPTPDDPMPSRWEVPNPEIDPNPLVDYTRWEIKNGKFYLDGKWVFLKIGKPLINFSDEAKVNVLIDNLDRLRQKYYNTLELNCYWHHFDTNGDGVIDKSLAPLNKLINAIYEKGMYPCLTVETYSVGGGKIPDGFWITHPDAEAINDKGNKVTDTEYGFNTRVVSLFHPGYLTASRNYIKNLASGIDTRKILYFETTVEPQYMGDIHLCYSTYAKQAYQAWRAANNITDAASAMPSSFPIPEAFIKNETWNKFRAQYLAEWINGDAAAYREIAGQNAYVAVDYLDADEAIQYRRDGNPIEFLTALTAPTIIQVIWHWHYPDNTPNQKAYDRVWQVIRQTNRDWAVSEHMTFSGSGYTWYTTFQLEKILENTLMQGTRFGWEFTNVHNDSSDDFCLYEDDWSPRHVISLVDNYWGYWLLKTERIEKEKQP
jgi:hypothetical protein